jgi:hypothetical protein
MTTGNPATHSDDVVAAQAPDGVARPISAGVVSALVGFHKRVRCGSPVSSLSVAGLCETRVVTVHRVLEYLGLRREAGKIRTTVERVWTGVAIAAILVAMFATRNLDFWPQIGVLAVVATAAGVLGAVVLGHGTREPRGD